MTNDIEGWDNWMRKKCVENFPLENPLGFLHLRKCLAFTKVRQFFNLLKIYLNINGDAIVYNYVVLTSNSKGANVQSVINCSLEIRFSSFYGVKSAL